MFYIVLFFASLSEMKEAKVKELDVPSFYYAKKPEEPGIPQAF
jgi:predicted HAD superfamily phosphohydrolase YqeG